MAISAKDAVQKFKVELLQELPLDEPLFFAMAERADLFPVGINKSIKTEKTRAHKVDYFLDHVVEPGADEYLPKLLKVMRESKVANVVRLADDIQAAVGLEEISTSLTVKSIAAVHQPSTVSTPDIGGLQNNIFETTQESTSVEFSANEKMESAFGRLIMKFISELNRPPPYGQSLINMKVLCINYCNIHHYENSDSLSSVSSMNDLFSKIAEPQYCNFLNLSLLNYLAQCTGNECLKTSVKNYDNTFENVQIKKELKNIGIGCKVKAIRSGLRCKLYEMMFIKLIRKGITYGQVKQIEVKICSRIIHIHPNSLIKKWYRKGSVCLGWLIPSCLIDAAYHSACTNIAVFGQLGIKYLIIGNYKIKPPLPFNSAALETPMGLFCKQYQYLVQKLHPVKVSVYMFAKGLLNKRDYTMIMNAPTDHIKNCMIIEYVRHLSSPFLFTFLDVLQQIEDQRCIFNILISALASAGFLNLSDDCEIILDEDEDGDDHTEHSFHTCLDHYVNSCLKMNLSVKGKIQCLLTDHKELKETKLPDMNIQYLCLIDDLCELIESCDPGVFTDKCASLMVSDVHNIPFFGDDYFVKDFGEYHNVTIMLRYLMCYFTWCDLSMIQELLETCGYPDGVRLLKKFNHQIECTRQFTEYAIPSSHSLMIPSDSSPYTVMVTQYKSEHISLSLKHIEVIKSVISESCEIKPVCCYFLAKAIDYHFFHWLIPKSVAPMVARKAQENCIYLHKHGIEDMSIFPTSETFFAYENKKFSLFYADPDVDKVDPDVDITNPHVDKFDIHVDKVPCVDAADPHVVIVNADDEKVTVMKQQAFAAHQELSTLQRKHQELVQKYEATKCHKTQLCEENSSLQQTLNLKQTKIQEQQEQLRCVVKKLLKTKELVDGAVNTTVVNNEEDDFKKNIEVYTQQKSLQIWTNTEFRLNIKMEPSIL